MMPLFLGLDEEVVPIIGVDYHVTVFKSVTRYGTNSFLAVLFPLRCQHLPTSKFGRKSISKIQSQLGYDISIVVRGRDTA